MRFESIDRLSAEPVWVQLYTLLKSGIEDETWPPRTPLPSARQIQEETGLARQTVHKAFARLQAEGLITMVPGRGPHVAARKPG